MQSRPVLVVLAMAVCTAYALDAACVDIILPPQVLDSGCAGIYPEIAVKNSGSESLPNIPVSFNIVRSSNPTDTIYHDTASSGPIGAGQTGLVDFGSACSPDPDAFTMTGITELPGDSNPANDTCSMPLFVRYVDVAVEIVSPRDTEAPGLIPVQVRLANNGNLPTMVPRVEVRITAGYYPDYRENIMIGVGENQVVTWVPWSYTGGTETCTAWITCPYDMNHSNDTDVVIVNPAGIQDRVESQPPAGMSLALVPSPLVGNVLQVEYSLTQAGPANVTLFDIRGRAVAMRDCSGASAGKFPMNLRRLSGGVYLVRLDDGRQSLVQKLVVQR